MHQTLPLVGVVAVAAALTACGSSAPSADKPQAHVTPHSILPEDRLIVLGRSIGAVSLGEPRARVTRALGFGKRASRGVVAYFGGRLLVSYWFHDRLTQRVTYIKTTWDGFRTRSGVHVGTSRRDLRLPPGSCFDRICGLAAGKGADAPGTGFGIRDERIAWIAVGYS